MTPESPYTYLYHLSISGTRDNWLQSPTLTRCYLVFDTSGARCQVTMWPRSSSHLKRTCHMGSKVKGNLGSNTQRYYSQNPYAWNCPSIHTLTFKWANPGKTLLILDAALSPLLLFWELRASFSLYTLHWIPSQDSWRKVLFSSPLPTLLMQNK